MNRPVLSTKIVALSLALVVVAVLVAPSVDLDPTTICAAGLLSACISLVYRGPGMLTRVALPVENEGPRPPVSVTDLICSRLC